MNKINTMEFLEYYERYPFLWNPKEPDYRNNCIRLAALKSIIKKMNLTISIEELKAKIKNIRTTYNREARKITNSQKRGAGTDDEYKPQLYWFSTADRFLKPVIEGKIRNKNSMAKNEKEEDSDINTSSDVSSYFDDLEEESETEPVVKKKKMLSLKQRAVLVQKEDPSVLEVNRMESWAQNNRQDEFDTFGQHVANQLRSLPLANAIACQNFVNNYLSQERLKTLNSQHLLTPTPKNSSSEHKRHALTPRWSTTRHRSTSPVMSSASEEKPDI